MAKETVAKLKRAAHVFGVPYLILLFDFTNERKFDKTSTDDQIVDGMIEDLAEGAIS